MQEYFSREPEHIHDILQGMNIVQGFEFVNVLNLDLRTFFYYLNKLRTNPRHVYELFTRQIGKKEREFLVPSEPDFKLVQKKMLSNFLRQLLRENPSPIGFSNRIGKSIRAIALKHLESKPLFLLNLDLENAFPNVTLKHYQWALWKAIQHSTFEDNTDRERWSKVINTLRYFFLYEDRLPLGPSTSPAIFELCCMLGLDQGLERLMIEKGLIITRYVDDIQISSSDPIPEKTVDEVREIVSQSLFELNEKKTVFISAESRSNTLPMLGLFLDLNNNNIQIKREVRERFRAAIFSLTQELQTYSPITWREEVKSAKEAILDKVIGRICYTWGILKQDGDKFDLETLAQRIPKRIWEPFERFLPVMAEYAYDTKIGRIFIEKFELR